MISFSAYASSKEDNSSSLIPAVANLKAQSATFRPCKWLLLSNNNNNSDDDDDDDNDDDSDDDNNDNNNANNDTNNIWLDSF